MFFFKNKLITLIFIFLISCSSIPKNTANSCSIFNEKYLWYKHTKKAEEKWGTPIYVQLAIIKMESDFDWLAKPARQKIFKIIPFKRPSSSFGYSQAVRGTWEQYKKETGNKLATRVRFKDSVDFIGWYTNKTETILKISKKDAFKQYIAYHEGWGNFKYYKKNKKVIGLANKVKKQSNIYKKQLINCKSSLNRNKYITIIKKSYFDGSKYESPNSGISEAVFAYTSNIKLGGKSKYNDEIIEKPIINSNGAICTKEKINLICQLILRLQILWIIIFTIIFFNI